MYKREGGPAALPIYVQVSEQLIREIAAGRFMDGERLPPEQKLAAAHGVTVRTLRKSLKVLEEKGLLDRIQGSGNYVRTNRDIRSIYSMFRIELLQGGGLPTATFLDISTCRKPSDLPEFGTSDDGCRMRRLRFLSDTPVAVEEIWLDADSGVIDPEQVSDSLYHTYQKRLGFWISRAEDYLGLGPVPDWAPPEFGCPAGDKTVLIERLSWAQKPQAVEYSRTWMDPQTARYVQRLK